MYPFFVPCYCIYRKKSERVCKNKNTYILENIPIKNTRKTKLYIYPTAFEKKETMVGWLREAHLFLTTQHHH